MNGRDVMGYVWRDVVMRDGGVDLEVRYRRADRVAMHCGLAWLNAPSAVRAAWLSFEGLPVYRVRQ